MNKNLYIFFVAVIFLAIYPTHIYAANFEEVGRLACAVAGVVGGNIAKAIATIGIVFLGARAFIGKLDWPTVLIVALGVFIVFGFVPLIKTIVSFAGIANYDAACPTS